MISDHSLAEALSNKYLQLILLPTEKCNFRCTYCYEDFAIGKMKRQTIDGVKALIANRVPELSRFSLTWFGGEPLLARDVVFEIGSFARDICNQHSVAFDAGLTTNSYELSPQIFSQLLDIGHTDYQITLDGDEEWHDKTRVLANSQGTFAKIWHNLTMYRQEKQHFSITLRLHVHRENIESVRRLYGRLKSDLLTDSRFVAFFHKVSNLSGEKGIPQSELDSTEYAAALKYITDSADIQKEISADVTLTDYICYAARPNSILIRADGRIGKCTVALNDPRNDVGTLLSDGAMDIKNDKIRAWFEGYRDMSETTLACPLSTLPKSDNLIQLRGI